MYEDMCMAAYLYEHCVHMVPEKYIRFPGTRVTVNCEFRLVFGTEPGSSARAESTLNTEHCPSPGLKCFLHVLENFKFCAGLTNIFYASQPHVLTRRNANKLQGDMPTVLFKNNCNSQVLFFFKAQKEI